MSASQVRISGAFVLACAAFGGVAACAGLRTIRPERTASPRARPSTVAATALEHDTTVLHDEHDFDLIAEATGLSARWIILPGTGHGGAS